MNTLKLTLGALLVLATATLSALPAHATTNTTCIDGSKPENIVKTWNSVNGITVSTKDGKPVCKDTTVFLTSYTMPDTWDGKGFNKTALPQTKFDSKSTTFKAGEKNASVALKVSLPEDCKNAQIDLYYAPEIKQLTTGGHGPQYLSHQLRPRSGECKVTVVEPPKEQPKVEEPKVLATTTEVPVELPKTGASAIGAVVTVLASALTYAVVLKRQN